MCLLDSICGLLCIIHSQIGDSVQWVFQSNVYFSAVNDDKVTVRSFTITPYQFSDSEKYDFEWNSIRTDPNRFQRFQFV